MANRSIYYVPTEVDLNFFCFLSQILHILSLVQYRWAAEGFTFVLGVTLDCNLQSKVRETPGRHLTLCACAIRNAFSIVLC